MEDKGISDKYRKMGVEKYYARFGSSYTNPHYREVRLLLMNNASRLDYSNTLDFCCGAGEVSTVLEELGFSSFEGMDPFTEEAFKKNHDVPFFDSDFDTIIKEGLPGKYSSVICSFAMHLCPEEKLYPLCSKIFESSPSLVIITPHKRPDLSVVDGITLEFEDFVLTAKGKKVRLRTYSHSYIGTSLT